MNFKRRGNRISLYKSTWIPKGPDVPHGYTLQTFVGSIAADATELPSGLQLALSPDERRTLERRVIEPARLAKETGIRQARLRAADPGWRLEEALRLVNEAAECSLTSAVQDGKKRALKSALENVRAVGAATSHGSSVVASEPLREALKAVKVATEAVKQGRYGHGPKIGFRNTSVFRQWTEIVAAVDGGEHSLLRALQGAGFATKRSR